MAAVCHHQPSSLNRYRHVSLATTPRSCHYCGRDWTRLRPPLRLFPPVDPGDSPRTKAKQNCYAFRLWIASWVWVPAATGLAVTPSCLPVPQGSTQDSNRAPSHKTSSLDGVVGRDVVAGLVLEDMDQALVLADPYLLRGSSYFSLRMVGQIFSILFLCQSES